MSNFELACAIRHNLLVKIGGVRQFKMHWGEKFCFQQVTDKIKIDGMTIDLRALTREQCLDLGFGKWEEGNRLLLIPIWLLEFLEPTNEVISITGETILIKDADNDERYGYLAYGVER